MRHRLLFVAVLGIALSWLLSFSPGCKPLDVPAENQGWWDDADAGGDPRGEGYDGAGEDEYWVDFDDGGDYADDLDDYYDGGY